MGMNNDWRFKVIGLLAQRSAACRFKDGVRGTEGSMPFVDWCTVRSYCPIPRRPVQAHIPT